MVPRSARRYAFDRSHAPEIGEAVVDLLAREPLYALDPELLDVERRQHRAVGHRAPQRGVVDVAVLRGQVAEEAAGERVAGAGRVDHRLERVGRQGEEALFVE